MSEPRSYISTYVTIPAILLTPDWLTESISPSSLALIQHLLYLPTAFCTHTMEGVLMRMVGNCGDEAPSPPRSLLSHPTTQTPRSVCIQGLQTSRGWEPRAPTVCLSDNLQLHSLQRAVRSLFVLPCNCRGSQRTPFSLFHYFLLPKVTFRAV
jgi:hypothetical protein